MHAAASLRGKQRFQHARPRATEAQSLSASRSEASSTLGEFAWCTQDYRGAMSRRSASAHKETAFSPRWTLVFAVLAHARDAAQACRILIADTQPYIPASGHQPSHSHIRGRSNTWSHRARERARVARASRRRALKVSLHVLIL